VDKLEQAITERKPDLSTMEYVRNWFGKHIPGLAGAVVSVVVRLLGNWSRQPAICSPLISGSGLAGPARGSNS